MADKKVKYVEDVLTLEVDKADALDERSVTPTPDSSKERRLVMKEKALEVGTRVASLLTADPARVRLKKGLSGAQLLERVRRVREINRWVAAGERMQAMLKREQRLRRHELQQDLGSVYRQIKSQREEDETLWSDFEELVDLFKPES